MTSTSTQSGPPASSSRVFVFVVVALITVGLLGVAFLATSRDSVSSDVNEEQTADVEIDGDSLPPIPDGVIGITSAANDSAVGSIVPTLTGTDFEDNEITIEADGRPKVIYFLAHWCQHCQAEVPVVQELIDEGSQPEGL
ncbi:MAG: hypothetical protein GY773_17770, partial [Actinomycetia bacterium]|nr:hypothetical protein [Actinomycetes bacterium]